MNPRMNSQVNSQDNSPGRDVCRLSAAALLVVGLSVACGSDAGKSTAPTRTEVDSEPIVPTLQEYQVPAGSRPHDVAPAPDGTVWYTAQRQAALGRLDPATGETRHIALGSGSAPHGVIVGPDGLVWVTDGGLNAIVSVHPVTEEIRIYPLPDGTGNANLNTATFDLNGVLWFTGQNGIYGQLDPQLGEIEVFASPRGRGPYGIASTPQGSVYSPAAMWATSCSETQR